MSDKFNPVVPGAEVEVDTEPVVEAVEPVVATRRRSRAPEVRGDIAVDFMGGSQPVAMYVPPDDLPERDEYEFYDADAIAAGVPSGDFGRVDDDGRVAGYNDAVTGLEPDGTVNVEEGDGAVYEPRKLSRLEKRAIATKGRLTSPWASIIAVILAILWTLPSLGLLVTSFRPVIDIRGSGWWTVFGDIISGRGVFTLENYQTALGGNTNLGTFFINSFVITIPAVVIPIALALLAAYAFAWIDFPGRNILFIAVFALQVVPLQVALVPLMRDFISMGIAGSFWTVWIAHAVFGLPLAIFLLHNFMKEIPSSLIEAARVDGAGHVKIFFRVLLPLLTPAIASFGIFQFLWVWNDLLVGLTFTNTAFRPLTVAVAELAGSRGGQWQLLSAGAFISMIVPLVVFLALQKYFVRGLLAGAVKG